MNDQDPKRLTVNDPVSREELDRITQLDAARAGIAEKNLLLDQEKVNLIAAARRLESEYKEAFNKILVERGLPTDTLININMKTGDIRLQQQEDPSSEEEV